MKLLLFLAPILAFSWPSFHELSAAQLIGMGIGSIVGGWITVAAIARGNNFSKLEKRIARLAVIAIFFFASFFLGSLAIHRARVQAVDDAIKQTAGPNHLQEAISYYEMPKHHQELKSLLPKADLTEEDCQDIVSKLKGNP